MHPFTVEKKTKCHKFIGDIIDKKTLTLIYFILLPLQKKRKALGTKNQAGSVPFSGLYVKLNLSF